MSLRHCDDKVKDKFHTQPDGGEGYSDRQEYVDDGLLEGSRLITEVSQKHGVTNRNRVRQTQARDESATQDEVLYPLWPVCIPGTRVLKVAGFTPGDPFVSRLGCYVNCRKSGSTG